MTKRSSFKSGYGVHVENGEIRRQLAVLSIYIATKDILAALHY